MTSHIHIGAKEIHGYCILKDEEQETSARISVILPPEQHFLRIDSTDIFTIIIMATVAQIYMQKVGRAAQEITYCACKLLKSNQWTQSTKVMKSAELRPFLFTGPTLCKDKIRSGRALASLVPRQFSAAR